MRLYAPGLPVIFMCHGRSTIAAFGKGDSLPQEIVRTPEALARGQEDTKTTLRTAADDGKDAHVDRWRNADGDYAREDLADHLDDDRLFQN